MKYLKMLGLAAVSAMALMAFLGAGTASATVLCKTAMTEGCAAAGWAYPAGTVIDSSLEGPAVLETTEGVEIDTCTEGTVKGATSNAGSSTETVSGNIEETEDAGGVKTFPGLTWGNCTQTTDTLRSGSLEVHWIAGTDNGTVTGKNSRVTVNTFGVSCIFGTAGTGTHIGTLTATPKNAKGETEKQATLDIEAIVPKIEGGFLCPADARWTGSYRVTSPEPLHISTS
jgi:hypothetical protein